MLVSTIYNHIGKNNHDYDVDVQWQWLTGFSSCIKKCPHGIFSHEVVLRVTAIIRMLLFVYTDSVKPKRGCLGCRHSSVCSRSSVAQCARHLHGKAAAVHKLFMAPFI